MAGDATQELRRAMTLSWIIWGAMMGLISIDVGIVIALRALVRSSPVRPAALMRVAEVLFVVAVAQLAALPFFRRFLIRRAAQRKDPGAPAAAQSLLGIGTMGRRYVVCVVLTAAVAEGVAIYGLALFMAGASLEVLLMLAAASALGMLLVRPKAQELQGLAAQREGA